MERTKILVDEIPKRAHPPETIRVSVIPRSRGYADVRVYRGGHPTHQGVAIHVDLLPAVLAALGTIAEGRIPLAAEANASGRDSWQ